MKTVFSIFLAASPHRGSTHPEQPEGPQLLSGEPHSASQHQAARAEICVCEHLYLISVYFVPLLARCVWRYQKRYHLREVTFWVWKYLKMFPYKLMVTVSSLYAILVYERFHKNTLLLDSLWGEICTHYYATFFWK